MDEAQAVTAVLAPSYVWVTIGIVGGLIVILMAIAVNFVKKGTMKAEDWQEKSLGIPKGSVRALIALLFCFIAIGAWVTTGQMPEWLIGILGTIIGFYFGSKATK